MKLAWIERMMVRELETLKKEVEATPDDETLWTSPPGVSNSIGNLSLHLCGNLQHFIGAVLGKTGYVRQRDAEFSTRNMPRAELVAGIGRTQGVVTSVLTAGGIDLEAEYPELVGGKFRVVTGEWLVHLEAHLAFHVGQAGYLRRILTGTNLPVPSVGIPALSTSRKVSE